MGLGWRVSGYRQTFSVHYPIEGTLDQDFLLEKRDRALKVKFASQLAQIDSSYLHITFTTIKGRNQP